MLKQTLAVVGLAISLTTNAAVISSDDAIGSPLATGSVQFFNDYIGANTTFAYSVHFSTDAYAALGSGAVIGLQLEGVSGFIGPFTISLYQDNYITGETTSVSALVASATGTNLSNITISPNTNYSFVIEGTSASTSNNALSGSFAISAVPVPAAAWLFGSALLGLAGYSRKR